MGRLILLGWLVTASAAYCAADQLYLKDGRLLEGTVIAEEDSVLLRMGGATLRFPKSDVLRIDYKLTPEEEFRQKLDAIAPADLDKMFTLAQWAEDNDLSREARQVCQHIVEVNPDHAGARAMLGFARIDGKWLTFDAGLELAQGKLQAGQFKALLSDVLPELQKVASTRDRTLAVEELQGQALLRNKQFADAARCYSRLAESADRARARRFTTIAELLKQNPDGMYVVKETYPTTASLLGQTQGVLAPGPASLADPRVLQAAMHDCAKEHIDAGRKLMDEARKLEPTEPDQAKARYGQAVQSFDRADALVANISRGYRVELARREISRLRKNVQVAADRFDQAVDKLGQQEMTAYETQNALNSYLRILDGIRTDLNAILAVAKPYPSELVMEITWAQNDLQQIERRRKVLIEELQSN